MNMLEGSFGSWSFLLKRRRWQQSASHRIGVRAVWPICACEKTDRLVSNLVQQMRELLKGNACLETAFYSKSD